jgi:hypothetical protein
VAIHDVCGGEDRRICQLTHLVSTTCS